MPSHSPELQMLLQDLYTGISFEGIARPSGQRVVYFAELPNLRRDMLKLLKEESAAPAKVVVKVSSGNDPHSIAYLEKEISVLNAIESNYYPRLHHHELVSFHPATEDPLLEKLFVTIEERKEAVPLSERRSEFGTERGVLELMIKLVDGLSVLWDHESKLVHRDIKPDNILIGPNKEVYIIDLGILRETGATGITATHAPFGPMSPHYSSPEQVNNDKKNISFKSDCFVLATVCYELLAGVHPYIVDGETSPHTVMSRVVQYMPPPLNERCSCSKEFGDLIVRMMQKEPYRRHRTISSLRADLLKLMDTPQ